MAFHFTIYHFANYKLQVTGSATFNGMLTAKQGFTFDNTNGINFTPNGAGGGTFKYGGANPPANPAIPCAAQPYPPVNHLFGGWLQIYDYNNPSTSGLLNLQTWTGGSSIDASVGANLGSGGLLLNYFCGNDTYINTYNGPQHNGGTFF